MKKLSILIILILITGLIITGCTQEVEDTTTNTNTETNDNTANLNQNENNQEPESIPKEKDYGFIQTIAFSDENSSTKIVKNKLLKTATLEMEMDGTNLETEFGDMAEFTTAMSCGLMRLAFFNESGLAEFGEAINSWNLEDAEVVDDSPEEEQELEVNENLLEGYEVTKVKLSFVNKNDNSVISECIITGPSENDMVFTYN